MVLKPCVALAALLVAAVSAQTLVGGENYGIPLAQPTVPFDKCSVSAANDASMRLTAFSWGYNNEYWMAKQSDNWGPWGEWQSIGGFFAGGPTVIRNANNDLVVFGLAASNLKDNLAAAHKVAWYRVIREDAEGEWIPLGGALQSGRLSGVLDPQGLIHIFARGSDSSVWEKRQYANGTEAIWGDWTNLGAVVTSDIACVIDAEGIIHLFTRGVDGFLWTMTQKLEEDGSLNWIAWTKSEQSVLLSSEAHIVARLNAQNLIEVIARGADKAFWHTRQAVNDERGVIWTPWKSLGGIHASAPALQINSDSLLTVYGVGAEKGIWYKQQAHHPVTSSSDAWSKWVPLGGRFSAGADVVSDSRGYINIFGRGLDRAIWNRAQLYSNHTVGFFGPWYSLGGRFRSFAC